MSPQPRLLRAITRYGTPPRRCHAWVQLLLLCASLFLAMVPDAIAQRGYRTPPPPANDNRRQPLPRAPNDNRTRSGPTPRQPTYQGARPAQPGTASRPLPSTIRQNSPVASLRGYTGQATLDGKPVIQHAGQNYQIPQRGISTSLGLRTAAFQARWDAQQRAKKATALAALAKADAARRAKLAKDKHEEEQRRSDERKKREQDETRKREDQHRQLSNAAIRTWYDDHVKALDTSGSPTRTTASRVHAARNALKQQARDMMPDRAEAAQLDRDHPLQPLHYYIDKYTKAGYKGQELWKRIIEGGTTPNKAVNDAFGID